MPGPHGAGSKFGEGRPVVLWRYELAEQNREQRLSNPMTKNFDLLVESSYSEKYNCGPDLIGYFHCLYNKANIKYNYS